MITGANTNVRYRDIVFHVQTEDSGRANPHVISHLFHGGTILASEKLDYSDRVDVEDLEVVVRGLIEQQHKAMLKRLKAGDFDSTISERLGDTTAGAGETPKPATSAAKKKPAGKPAAPAAKKKSVGKPAPQPAAAAAAPRAERTFGEGIGPQQPLDEVILEYLAEKARERRPERAGPAARKSRKQG